MTQANGRRPEFKYPTPTSKVRSGSPHAGGTDEEAREEGMKEESYQQKHTEEGGRKEPLSS